MNQKIINISLAIIFTSVSFLACKESSKALLCKKWKTVSIQNRKMDEEIAFMKTYIDTLGAQDPELGKNINLDSVKLMLNADFQQSMKEQQIALENTIMEFKSNGVSYTTSIDGLDSAMYTVEGQFIKFDEAKLKGHGETMTFEILKLDQDTLRVKLIDYGDTSIATMVPVKG
jgi:hypothetical protein